VDEMIAASKLRSFALIIAPRRDPPHNEPYLEGSVELFNFLILPTLSTLALSAPPSGDIDFLNRFLTCLGCSLSSVTFVNFSEKRKAFEDTKDSLIRQAGGRIREEFAIPSVEFSCSLGESRLYREAKERWYGLRDDSTIISVT